jgi:hypothetical protein
MSMLSITKPEYSALYFALIFTTKIDDHLTCFLQVQMFLHRIGRVKKLTNNLQFILDTVMLSTVVEVQVIDL